VVGEDGDSLEPYRKPRVEISPPIEYASLLLGK
jgi:hypothetical protein